MLFTVARKHVGRSASEDLAVATGQPVPFTEDEAARTLARAEVTLPPKFRGEGMPFGPIVPVDGDDGAVDRCVAFLGRDPRSWGGPA